MFKHLNLFFRIVPLQRRNMFEQILDRVHWLKRNINIWFQNTAKYFFSRISSNSIVYTVFAAKINIYYCYCNICIKLMIFWMMPCLTHILEQSLSLHNTCSFPLNSNGYENVRIHIRSKNCRLKNLSFQL